VKLIEERTDVIPCRIITENVACTVQMGRIGDGLRLRGNMPDLLGNTLGRLGDGRRLLRLGRQ
jgi:hypothetical protein